jgi:hypothetical protein
MNTKIFKGESLREGISIAISNRLYVPGWNMRLHLGWALEDLNRDNVTNEINCVVIAYIDGIAVGSGIVVDNETFQAFVRKKHRRKRIATSMHKVVNKFCGKLGMDCHDDVSLAFCQSISSFDMNSRLGRF